MTKCIIFGGNGFIGVHLAKRLAEGGYEGGGAMVYYGQPTVWAPEIEQLVVSEVERQISK